MLAAGERVGELVDRRLHSLQIGGVGVSAAGERLSLVLDGGQARGELGSTHVPHARGALRRALGDRARAIARMLDACLRLRGASLDGRTRCAFGFEHAGDCGLDLGRIRPARVC